MATLKLEGAAQLDSLLMDFPRQIKKRIIANAVSAGATVMRQEVERQAPIQKRFASTYPLKKSILSRKVRGKDFYHVGPSRRAPHAHLVEFGTGPRKFKKPHFVNLGGRRVFVTHSGIMPANPFMRRAFNIKGVAAVNKILRQMEKRIHIEARRLRLKHGTMRRR